MEYHDAGQMNPSNADTVPMPAKSRFPSFFVFLFLILGFSSAVHAAVLSSDPGDETLVEKNKLTEAFLKNEGGAAKIVDVSGEVRILKNGSEDWAAVAAGDFIQSGDQILTGASGTADIAIDSYLLNIAHIAENTKAEFRSLKPTDIYMEDGSIYSALDGLGAGDGYQIATPTAVAAVRGTHFEVGYDGANKKFSATAVPTDDPEHQSRVLIHAPDQSSETGVEITDGKQLDLMADQRPEQRFIRQADPAKIMERRAFLPRMSERVKDFKALREEGKVRFGANRREMKNLPPGQGPKQGQGPLPGQNQSPQKLDIPQNPQTGKPADQPRRSYFEENSGTFPRKNESGNFDSGSPEFRSGGKNIFPGPKPPAQGEGRKEIFVENRNPGNFAPGQTPLNPPQNGFVPPQGLRGPQAPNGPQPQQQPGPQNNKPRPAHPPAQKQN